MLIGGVEETAEIRLDPMVKVASARFYAPGRGRIFTYVQGRLRDVIRRESSKLWLRSRISR